MDTQFQKFTVEEFQADFDNLLERVENGESFIITDGGKQVMIMPTQNYEYILDSIENTEDLIRIHTDHDEAS
jgi:prevent-host-death family protein